jgi:transcriptional regulator with XRE-family HTH domain
MDFGQEIRRRRKAAAWTLEVLAEKSGLSPHYLSTVENGARDPSLSTITALARAFGVPPGILLGAMRDLSPAACDAGRLFDAAPPPLQEAVLRILQTVARRAR